MESRRALRKGQLLSGAQVRRALVVSAICAAVASLLAVSASSGDAARGVARRAGLAFVRGTARSAPTVWVASANGRNAHRIGRGVTPMLSPDGRLVAIQRFAPRGHPLLVRTASGRLVGGFFGSRRRANASAIAWSPDSRYLAVSVGDEFSKRSALVVLDVASGRVTTIAQGFVFGASFAPSRPDRLVFGLSHRLALSAPVDLFRATVGGGAPRRLTRDGRSLHPLWGSRGIVFDRERLRHRNAPEYQIYLLAHGRETRITHLRPPALASGLVPLALSADGSRLLAEYEGQDVSEAWAVDLRGHDARQLRLGHKSVTGWGISDDGERVLIQIGGFYAPPSTGKIATMPFAGGRPTVLLGHGAFPSWRR